jgi:hypothetical protein
MAISNVVCFWLFLGFVIPSIPCSIFDLYYFLFDRTLRKALNNHVVILIVLFGLFYTITDIIWFIDYYHTGSPLSSTQSFCLIWVYIDFAVFVSTSLLVAWASIERHILVFHQNFLATPTKRFFFHYLPLLIFSIYPFVYYLIVFFVLPCEIPFNYEKTRCGIGYCAFANPSLALWDSISNNIVPIFIIIIFSVGLIVRVWYNKYRLGQRFQWKNYRKMTIQLLSISSLYFFLYFPETILYTAYTAGLSYNVAASFFSTSEDFSYLIILLMPFVCAVSLSEFRKKFRKFTRIGRRRRHVVGPTTIQMSRFPPGGTVGMSRFPAGQTVGMTAVVS